jgi:hypothetical protein
MRRTTTDGITIQGTGRWISIQLAPAITPRHSLWDYGDDNGDGTRSAYIFTHYGRRFSLDQFVRFGSVWGASYPLTWEEADGLHHMAGYEAHRYDAPLMIELNEYGDAVRVWQEVARQ